MSEPTFTSPMKSTVTTATRCHEAGTARVAGPRDAAPAVLAKIGARPRVARTCCSSYSHEFHRLDAQLVYICAVPSPTRNMGQLRCGRVVRSPRTRRYRFSCRPNEPIDDLRANTFAPPSPPTFDLRRAAEDGVRRRIRIGTASLCDPLGNSRRKSTPLPPSHPAQGLLDNRAQKPASARMSRRRARFRMGRDV